MGRVPSRIIGEITEKQMESAKEVEDVFEKPKEIGSEMAQSQVVPPNIHEEETTNTVSHRLSQPILHDQVIVSNLTEAQSEQEPVEMASQKVVSREDEEGDRRYRFRESWCRTRTETRIIYFEVNSSRKEPYRLGDTHKKGG